MAAKKEEKKKEIKLNPQEQDEYEQGRFLYEMDRHNPGWQVIKEWYKDMAHHSWVEPR